MGFVSFVNTRLRTGVRESAEGGVTSLGEVLARVPKDLSVPSGVRFRVVVYGQARELQAGVGEEIYRICREAIHNAYRHSQARVIEAEIEFRPGELRVAVRDNGCGIDAAELHREWNRYWGLKGMRDRAARIGAQLNLFSKVARGTEVELRVPDRVAFEQSASLR